MALRSFSWWRSCSDKLLIKQVLQNSKGYLKKADLIIAHGQSAAESLGRSIVATKRTPVVLILDADTNDPEVVSEKKSFFEASLRAISGNVPWLVILMVPEIEVVFFRAPQTLKTLNATLNSSLLSQGQAEPKKTLTKLLRPFGLTVEGFIKQGFSKAAVSQLADLSEFQQLREFLSDPYRHPTADHPHVAHRP